MAGAKYLLSCDDDLLRLEPRLEDIWPRTNPDGSARFDWRAHHEASSAWIERRLRASKATPDRFQLGQLSSRSREDLREASACIALSFIFMSADTQGDDTGYYARKMKHYEARGIAAYTDAALLLDYDTDGDGIFGPNDQQQPFPQRLIRG
jgi:hypothetical protein